MCLAILEEESIKNFTAWIRTMDAISIAAMLTGVDIEKF